MDNDNPSCRNFSMDSSSTSQSDVQQTKNKKKDKKPIQIQTQSELHTSPQCSNIITSSTSSSSTSMSMGALNFDNELQKPSTVDAPNVGYELNIAKAVLQQYSTLSGDNL